MQEECKAPVIMLILRGFSLYNQRETVTNVVNVVGASSKRPDILHDK